MEKTAQGENPIKNIELSDVLASRLGRQALRLFGRDNVAVRRRARHIAQLVNGSSDAMVISAHFDQLVPTLGLSALDHLVIKLLEVAPGIARGLPFLSKRLAHIERVAEIALIFDVTRLRYIREALENYHGELA